ncbi:MAG: NHL repeat-containing protein [candidate division Zixibacteria bacterium]|nr:NHL repeat-containing protein [candidate division Zixibacteria bacterium]
MSDSGRNSLFAADSRALPRGTQKTLAVTMAAVLAAIGCVDTRIDIPGRVQAGTEFVIVDVIDSASVQDVVDRDAGPGSTISPRPFAPASFALLQSGSLVVADRVRSRILTIPRPDLAAGQSASSGRLQTSVAGLRDPRCLRVNLFGNVFVCDADRRRVAVFDAQLREGPPLIIPFESMGLVVGRLSGLAVGAYGDLYVADETNALVYHFDSGGGFMASLGGGAAAGWGRLVRPAGLAIAPDGSQLFICDPGAGHVAVFDSEGKPLRLFGGNDLKDPRAIATDRRGQCYVADPQGKSICVYSGSGTLSRTITAASVGIPDWIPCDLALSDSTLWVADEAFGRILMIRVRDTASR